MGIQVDTFTAEGVAKQNFSGQAREGNGRFFQDLRALQEGRLQGHPDLSVDRLGVHALAAQHLGLVVIGEGFHNGIDPARHSQVELMQR